MSKKNPQSGFSLVETLVAITILLLVIIGPMKISSSSAKSTSFASEQVTAFFLAQEGAELVQKVRDDLMLENVVSSAARPSPWTDFTSGTLASCYTGGCGITIGDNSAVSVRSCSTITDCALSLDTTSASARSHYVHTTTGTTPTPFTRVVTLQRTGNEVRVVSKVTWRTGSIREEQEVSVETSLFNVYGKN